MYYHHPPSGIPNAAGRAKPITGSWSASGRGQPVVMSPDRCPPDVMGNQKTTVTNISICGTGGVSLYVIYTYMLHPNQQVGIRIIMVHIHHHRHLHRHDLHHHRFCSPSPPQSTIRHFCWHVPSCHDLDPFHQNRCGFDNATVRDSVPLVGNREKRWCTYINRYVWIGHLLSISIDILRTV